jgi:hypothetical protein
MNHAWLGPWTGVRRAIQDFHDLALATTQRRRWDAKKLAECWVFSTRRLPGPRHDPPRLHARRTTTIAVATKSISAARSAAV